MDHARIEGVSGKRNALRTEDSMRAVAPRRRSHAKDRKIAGAAAEVSNEDEFIVIERALVEESRRYRLVLENHGTDSGFRERSRQSADSKLVVFLRVGIRIANRASHGNRPAKRSDLALRLDADLAQHDRDQVFERELLPKNTRSREEPAGEEGFQRLDQPSLFIRLQVPLDRDRPSDSCNTGLKVQDRAIGLGRSRRRLEPHGFDAAILASQRDRTVRGAEINANTCTHGSF